MRPGETLCPQCAEVKYQIAPDPIVVAHRWALRLLVATPIGVSLWAVARGCS